MNRLLICLMLIIGLLSCNSEESDIKKRNQAIEQQMYELDVPFSALSEVKHHYSIPAKLDSTTLDLSLSTFKSLEKYETERQAFIDLLNMQPGEHDIAVSSLTPENLSKYKILLRELEKFAECYQSLGDHIASFGEKQGRCVTALLNDRSYMNRLDFSWVFYFDGNNDLISHRNFGHNTNFFLDKVLETV